MKILSNKRSIALLLGIAAVAAVAWVFTRSAAADPMSYRFARVEKGDVQATVSATGTLSAVTTVQVGTQVSGQIAAIYVDFNDRVKRGQLLARSDATLAEQAVREAEANRARAAAEQEQAQREYDRNLGLYERKVVTDKEMNAALYALQVAQANARSAQVSVDRARQNLSFTAIHAPVDGIVVERNVDVGQTVAASLSAPQLFLIAQDLSEMQILAHVDESDIGAIRDGQEVHFTVQAYERGQFSGTVRQVRLQSSTTENVVSYTVVVSVQNPHGKLLPGMTATAEFVTGSAQNVLTVPNAALRFNPTGERTRERRIWVLGPNDEPQPIPVKVGLTDGTVTAVSGANVKEGMQVITGATGPAMPATTNKNPLQPQRQADGPPGAGG